MLDPENKNRVNALKQSVEVAGVIPNNFARRLKIYHTNLRYDINGEYTLAKRARELGPNKGRLQTTYKEKPKQVKNLEISVLKDRGFRMVNPAVLMPKNTKFDVEKDSTVMEFLKETGKIVSDGAFNLLSEQASKITSSLNPMVNQIKASAAKAFNENEYVRKAAEGWHGFLQDIDDAVQGIIEGAAAITIESDWYKTLQGWGSHNQEDYPTIKEKSTTLEKLKLSARKQKKLESFMEELKKALDELKDKDVKRNVKKTRNYSKDETEDRSVTPDRLYKNNQVPRNVEPMADEERPDALSEDKNQSRKVATNPYLAKKLHEEKEESRNPGVTETYGENEHSRNPEATEKYGENEHSRNPEATEKYGTDEVSRIPEITETYGENEHSRNPGISETHGMGEASRIPGVTETYDSENSQSRNFAKDMAYGERDEHLMQETNKEWKKFLEAAITKTFEASVTEKFKDLISKKRTSGSEAEVAALEEAYYYVIEPLERLTAAKYQEVREISGYTNNEASSDNAEDGGDVSSIINKKKMTLEDTKSVNPLYNERLNLGVEPTADPNTLNVRPHTEKLKATPEVDLGEEDPKSLNVPSNIEKLEATPEVDLGEEDPNSLNVPSNIEKLEATPEIDLGEEDPNSLNVPSNIEKLEATPEIDLGEEDPNSLNVPSNIEKLKATPEIDLGDVDPNHGNVPSNVEKLEATPEVDLGEVDPNTLNVRTLEESGKQSTFLAQRLREAVAEIERIKAESAEAEYKRLTGQEARNENKKDDQPYDPDKDYADALTLSENGEGIARVTGSELQDLIIENEDNKILSSLLRYLVNSEYDSNLEDGDNAAEANNITSPAIRDKVRAVETDLYAEYLAIAKKRWKTIPLMLLERVYSPEETTKEDIISLMDANESEYDVLNTLANLFARTTVGQNVLGKITEYTSTSAISKAYYKGVSWLTGKFWDKDKPNPNEPKSITTDELEAMYPDLDDDLYRWFNTEDGNMSKHILVSDKRLIPRLIALEAVRDQKRAEEQDKQTAEINGELSYFNAMDKVNEATQHIHITQNSDYGIADLATNFRVNKTFVGGEIEYFKSGYHHFFFVKPDLNLTENHIHVMECSGYQRLCDVIPELTYDLKGLEQTWTNGLFPPALSRIDRSTSHPYFSYLISNAIKGLNIPDYTLETKEGFENLFGHRFSFGTTGRKSGYQTDFSISFYDTSDLLLLNIFKVWTKYIEVMYEGQANLLTNPMQRGNLDYLGALYYFVLEPDNHSIVHWGRYTGIYPTNVPWSSIGMSTGSSDLPEFTVNFKCQWHEWNSLEVLQDFNFVMRGAGLYGGSSPDGNGQSSMVDTYFKLGSICKRNSPVITADPNLIGGATVSENRALVEFVDLLDLKNSKFAPNGSPTLRPYKYVLSFDSASDFSEMTNGDNIKNAKYNSFYSYVGEQGSIKETDIGDPVADMKTMESNYASKESYERRLNAAQTAEGGSDAKPEGIETEPSGDFTESESQDIFKDQGSSSPFPVDFGYNSENAYFRNGQ